MHIKHIKTHIKKHIKTHIKRIQTDQNTYKLIETRQKEIRQKDTINTTTKASMKFHLKHSQKHMGWWWFAARRLR